MIEKIKKEIMETVNREQSYLPANFRLPSNSMEPPEFYESYIELTDLDIENAIEFLEADIHELILDYGHNATGSNDFYILVENIEQTAFKYATGETP